MHGGVLSRGVLTGGFVRGVLSRGGFCPRILLLMI